MRFIFTLFLGIVICSQISLAQPIIAINTEHLLMMGNINMGIEIPLSDRLYANMTIGYENDKYSLFRQTGNMQKWQNVSFSGGITYYLFTNKKGLYNISQITMGYGTVIFDYYDIKERENLSNDPIVRGIYLNGNTRLGYEFRISNILSIAPEIGISYYGNKMSFSNMNEYINYEILQDIEDWPFYISSSELKSYYSSFLPVLSIKLRIIL